MRLDVPLACRGISKNSITKEKDEVLSSHSKALHAPPYEGLGITIIAHKWFTPLHINTQRTHGSIDRRANILWTNMSMSIKSSYHTQSSTRPFNVSKVTIFARMLPLLNVYSVGCYSSEVPQSIPMYDFEIVEYALFQTFGATSVSVDVWLFEQLWCTSTFTNPPLVWLPPSLSWFEYRVHSLYLAWLSHTLDTFVCGQSSPVPGHVLHIAPSSSPIRMVYFQSLRYGFPRFSSTST